MIAQHLRTRRANVAGLGRFPWLREDFAPALRGLVIALILTVIRPGRSA